MKDSEREHLKLQTPQWLAREARIRRDALLAECDWVALRAIETGESSTGWLEYRQALRDITMQSGFPHDIAWPEVPK